MSNINVRKVKFKVVQVRTCFYFVKISYNQLETLVIAPNEQYQGVWIVSSIIFGFYQMPQLLQKMTFWSVSSNFLRL